MKYYELYNQVLDLLPSKDLKQAIANHHTVLKPIELVKIIEGYAKSFDHRIILLEGLKDCTDDRAVIEFIERQIQYHLNSRAKFVSEDDGSVFELLIKETPDSYEEHYLCTSISAAMRYIPLFFQEYECAPNVDTYFEIKKRKIIGEHDAFQEDYIASCYLNDKAEPLTYGACGIKRNYCDGRCFDCNQTCIYNIQIGFPIFLDNLALVRYKTGNKHSYGIHLNNITDDDTIYVLDLANEVMVYKDFKNDFYAHEHIDAPLVEKVDLQDVPDDIRKTYEAYVSYRHECGLDTQREMIVVPYDSCWKTRFETIKNNLQKLFRDKDIEIKHFGSTSIEGMSAKPIIDIMILVDEISLIDKYTDELTSQGYHAKGENGIDGRRYFVKYAPNGTDHTEHIHCYDRTNPHVKNELLFCEYLKNNKEAFKEYQAVKLEAMEKYRYDPDKYCEYKSACIDKLLAQAKSHYKKIGRT